MPKVAIGSMRQKILIEGDENLLESHEVLIKEINNFEFILKERTANGSLKTYVVIPLEEYIKSLKEAYNEGLRGEGEDS